MKRKFTIVSAFLFCLSLAVAGCGAKDPFAGFEVPGYQAAPDTIFTDDTAANGLEGSAMYVDATVGASGKIGEYDSLTFTTSKGDLSLMDSALGSNWASLEEGQKIRAYFFYLGTSPITQTPSGMFVYGIDPANIPAEPPTILATMYDILGDGGAAGHPTAAPTPTPEPTPAPTPTVFEGKGDKILEDINLNGQMCTVHFTTKSSRHTAVKFHPASGSYDLLVNTVDPYDGYTLIMESGRLEITCSGSWTVEIAPLSTTDQTSFSGKGDFVTPILKAPVDAWKITHSGKSNIIVKQIGSTDSDLLVNDIGAYEGEVISTISAGENCLFEIQADGAWTIEPLS